jgi:hypothetical protein
MYKDNNAFGLVWRSSYGHPMLDYSGGDTDTSSYMARFPEQRLTIICLSNMPLGEADGRHTQCWNFSTRGASYSDNSRVYGNIFLISEAGRG